MIDDQRIKQTYEIRVRPWEHIALLAVMQSFDAGQVSLDMRKTGECLGSRVAQAGKRNPFVYMGLVYSWSLRELYFPGIRMDGSIDFENPGWDATPREATRAIAAFLVGGDLRWDHIMQRRHWD